MPAAIPAKTAVEVTFELPYEWPLPKKGVGNPLYRSSYIPDPFGGVGLGDVGGRL